MQLSDTIAAAASAPGRSARAVVRVSGSGTREVLGAVISGPARPFERGAWAGVMGMSTGDLPVLVMTFRTPASYTGEDAAEILMPGNPRLVELVMARLAAAGARAAGPGEFTARAYLNDKLTLDRAEGVAAVIAAESDEELAAARGLLGGQTGGGYREWADELTTLLALTEAGIDFTDQEDVVAIAPGALRGRLERVDAAIERHTGAMRGREAETSLPRIVLAGAPNAGKSTLFNALLGRERAVVSSLAGTTRDVLEEELDLAGDLPGAGRALLTDLAGLDAAPGGVVDAAAQGAARDAMARADVVVQCDPGGRFADLGVRGPVIRVRTKADLGGAGGDASGQGSVPVCALDGWNLRVLRRAIADLTGAARGAGLAALLPRHRRALGEVRAGIAATLAALGADRDRIGQPEVVAGALRGALDAVGELVGRISPDDVIGRVFATFCVGK